MAIRVNPKIIDDLAVYGAEDVQLCYHCGNCSAVCPHADEFNVFPRKPMRNLQMGLEKKLERSLEPWLCYYCGQCSEQCPRGAEPGETMMSLRRWLTSRYDVTGLSRLFYRSWKAEMIAILVLALLTGVAFFLFGMLRGDIHVYSGPGAFLPSSAVHLFDWSMAGVLAALLFVNSLHMWRLVFGSKDGPKPNLFMYLKHLPQLPWHFLTQNRFRTCQERNGLWLIHLLLVASYLTMLVLIMFFLPTMQSGPEIRWTVHTFGYAASIGLIGATIFMLHGRLKKTRTQFQHSHKSDWLFLIMLVYVALTGVLQHIAHRAGFPVAANLVYIMHMMGVVPMLVLEVPFSKWSHLAYRPLAMYLAAVQRDALLGRSSQGGEILAPRRIA
ncbi:MAG: 4Fe-4S dicluster domain-containing protein [Candidatus Aminicenantes bacterium]|nr:4Fe-4S dicluster domain-containing protein [Candidatus Aminicenantes bacterium]